MTTVPVLETERLRLRGWCEEDLSAFAGQAIRIEFAAADLATDQLLEAAVDDVKIELR